MARSRRRHGTALFHRREGSRRTTTAWTPACWHGSRPATSRLALDARTLASATQAPRSPTPRCSLTSGSNPDGDRSHRIARAPHRRWSLRRQRRDRVKVARAAPGALLPAGGHGHVADRAGRHRGDPEADAYGQAGAHRRDVAAAVRPSGVPVWRRRPVPGVPLCRRSGQHAAGGSHAGVEWIGEVHGGDRRRPYSQRLRRLWHEPRERHLRRLRPRLARPHGRRRAHVLGVDQVGRVDGERAGAERSGRGPDVGRLRAARRHPADRRQRGRLRRRDRARRGAAADRGRLGRGARDRRLFR